MVSDTIFFKKVTSFYNDAHSIKAETLATEGKQNKQKAQYTLQVFTTTSLQKLHYYTTKYLFVGHQIISKLIQVYR